MTELIKYEAARRALTEAHSVDEVLEIRNMAAMMRAYAKQSKDKEMEKKAREIRLRAIRRLGELIKAQKETESLAKGGGGYHDLVTGGKNPPVTKKLTLISQGIDKDLAKEARKLAALSELEFEEVVAEDDYKPKPPKQEKSPDWLTVIGDLSKLVLRARKIKSDVEVLRESSQMKDEWEEQLSALKVECLETIRGIPVVITSLRIIK